jgi:8-amino-7-oxononanoate synthase
VKQHFLHRLEQKLFARKAENSFRTLSVATAGIDFCSNDYLGLSQNEALYALVEQKVKDLKITNKLGATGSRLISGNHDYFTFLESWLAQIHESESALLFNSGYNANLAVLSTLPQKDDTIIYDELSHACIKDGARLSFASRFTFKHNDVEDLALKIEKAKGNVYVAIESIYSMDGDMAPLEAIAKLCQSKNACLIVDEAHSTGIWGNAGNGLVCALGLEAIVPVRIHTYGKAMGCHGACVVSNETIKDYLINFARPFIYTTAMPLHALVAIELAYQYIGQHPDLQNTIKNKIALFKQSSAAMADQMVNSQSAIQAILIEGNTAVKAKAKAINDMGFDVRPILSPTVKAGAERLRICLHNFNTDQDITALANLLIHS